MSGTRPTRATYQRRRLVAVVIVLLGCSTAWLALRSDSGPVTAGASRSSTAAARERAPADRYDSLRATGKAKLVLSAARTQLGVTYVYGAQPRDPSGLGAIGREVHEAGFDCSSFVAYAFQVGIDEWISGSVAHTDQIWTQGGSLPLDSTAGETDTITRGMATRPPRGGYRPGDLLLTRSGSGGYWGHVLIVSERGLVIQSYPPDVYETTHLRYYLDKPAGEVGWVRVKALSA